MKYLLHVYTEETTFGDNKKDSGRMKLMAQRHLEQKIEDCHFRGRNRDEDRHATGLPSEGKGKEHVKKQVLERRLHMLAHERPMFVWRFVRMQA